ncbi:MAG: MFS transporter [Thermoleophilia bacterium]|nr:MFS transporter [Thermoleophilia bacterium]
MARLVEVRPVAAYLRALNPDLPRVVWLLQAGGLANAFGNGVVIPFLVIYLHNVRGFSLAVIGLIAASNAVAALFSGTVGGALADRFGPRATLAGALCIMAGAFSLFPLIDEPWHAFALNMLAGLGSGAFWPSQSSLLARLAPVQRRHAAFAQQRVTMNLGIGLGGLTGGFIANAEEATTFTTLFLLDAATFLVFAALLTRIPSPARPARAGGPGSYARVLRNRPFRSFALLNTLFIAVSIAPFSEFLPVFAKNESAVSERSIGLIFFLNTALIALAQVPIAKWQEGRRRMGALAIMGVLWAVSWLVVAAAGAWTTGTTAVAVITAGVLVFAVGECLHGAVQGPLVADLADPALIGRYMALSSLSWQVGFIVGPAVGGVVLDAEPLALWPLAAAVCLVGSAWALALERGLPQAVRRTPHPEAAIAVPEPG